ncbi:MAG TPA: hypothetical protein VIV63_04085 [Steroidobacteraceae bacterium]
MRIALMRVHFSAVASFMLVATAALGGDRSFTGYARSLDNGELLYVESHAVSGSGSGESRVVLYRCAEDSAPFARKQLAYSAKRTMPTFDFEDARSGFAEGFARDSSGLKVFERAGAGAPMRSELISATAELVVDAGFDEFVRANWDSLERGAVSRVPFLVPSLLRSIDFRIRKAGETVIDGEAASVIRLSLAGALGWFTPDIDVSYRKRDRRLMRYRGLTNIRDAGGELLKAQIDFPDAAPATTAVNLAAMRALPLAPCP